MIISNSNFYIAICFHNNSWFWSKRNFNCIHGALTRFRMTGKLTAHYLGPTLQVTKSKAGIVLNLCKIIKTFSIIGGHEQKAVAFCHNFYDQQACPGMFDGIVKNLLNNAVGVDFLVLVQVYSSCSHINLISNPYTLRLFSINSRNGLLKSFSYKGIGHQVI